MKKNIIIGGFFVVMLLASFLAFYIVGYIKISDGDSIVYKEKYTPTEKELNYSLQHTFGQTRDYNKSYEELYTLRMTFIKKFPQYTIHVDTIERNMITY